MAANDDEFARLLAEAARFQVLADRAYLAAWKAMPKAMTPAKFAQMFAIAMEQSRKHKRQ